MQYDSVKIWYMWQDDKLGEAGGKLWWIKYDNEMLVIILYSTYYYYTMTFIVLINILPFL
jgi:hypothetical protein